MALKNPISPKLCIYLNYLITFRWHQVRLYIPYPSAVVEFGEVFCIRKYNVYYDHLQCVWIFHSINLAKESIASRASLCWYSIVFTSKYAVSRLTFVNELKKCSLNCFWVPPLFEEKEASHPEMQLFSCPTQEFERLIQVEPTGG